MSSKRVEEPCRQCGTYGGRCVTCGRPYDVCPVCHNEPPREVPQYQPRYELQRVARDLGRVPAVATLSYEERQYRRHLVVRIDGLLREIEEAGG